MLSPESDEQDRQGYQQPLSYATAELRAPRRSWLAISSLIAAILVLPADIVLTQALHDFLPPHRAELLGFGGFAVMAIGVLCLSILSLRRVRRSSGALKGRPVALVAFAISFFYLIPICLALCFDGDLRWK